MQRGSQRGCYLGVCNVVRSPDTLPKCTNPVKVSFHGNSKDIASGSNKANKRLPLGTENMGLTLQTLTQCCEENSASAFSS